jgi:hypothetical protein
LIGIGVAFFSPWLAGVLYGVVSVIWLVPDSRIEKQINPSAR